MRVRRKDGHDHETSHTFSRTAILASFSAALSSSPIAFVDFYAEQCPPCKAIYPLIEAWSDDPRYKDKIRFYKLDIVDVPDVADNQMIDSMPTFRIYKGGDGKHVEEFIGAAQPEKVREMLDRALEG